jgi:hypothetical protein
MASSFESLDMLSNASDHREARRDKGSARVHREMGIRFLAGGKGVTSEFRVRFFKDPN